MFNFPVVVQVSGAAGPDAPVQILLPHDPDDEYEVEARLEMLLEMLLKQGDVVDTIVRSSNGESATLTLQPKGMSEPLTVTFRATRKEEADEKVQQTAYVMQQVRSHSEGIVCRTCMCNITNASQ